MLFSIHEAQLHLSKLLEWAADGEEIVIADAGKPVARLIAFDPDLSPRQPGYWRGKLRIAEDFDAFPDDLEQAFYGESR